MAMILGLQSPYIPPYIGHVFGHWVVVLFLQLPLSSCVVREACTCYTPACITLTMYLYFSVQHGFNAVFMYAVTLRLPVYIRPYA